MHRTLLAFGTTLLLGLAFQLGAPGRAGATPGPPSGVGSGHGGSGFTPGGHLGRGVVDPTGLVGQTSVSHTQVTDSPTTHRRGTWWAEVGIVGFSHDATDTLRADSWEFAPVGVGYAFTDRFEVTAVGTTYGLDRVHDLAAGVLHSESSVGAFGLHAKACWFGSDSSAWSLGSMLFATRPARGDTTSPGVEFGARVPVAVALPADVTLGAMLEADRRNDPDGTGRHAEWVESLNLARDIAPHLSGFVELVHVSSTRPAQAALAALDAGFDWAPAPHVDVGLGGSLGTSGGRADDGVFGGISISR